MLPNNLTANFIADPNEWMSPVRHEDHNWKRRYRTFEWRLHWLLLWNTQVRVFDSFFLFNRHFEYWFGPKKNGFSAAIAAMEKGDEPPISVALRDNAATLVEVFERDMIGSPDYRWYFDGRPTDEYVGSVDAFLTHKVPYNGAAFPGTLHDRFWAAFREQEQLREMYEDNAQLRKQVPEPVLRTIDRLVSEHDNGWRRSILNDLLGYGITENGGGLLPCHPALKNTPPSVLASLRQHVDSCWCYCIHTTLGLPSRLPGHVPPRLLASFRDDYVTALGLSDEIGLMDWARADLGTRRNAAIRLRGDLAALQKAFGNLTPQDVWDLRREQVFRDYRRLYKELDDWTSQAGPEALADSRRVKNVTDVAVRCLQTLGQRCAIDVSPDPSGAWILGYRALPIFRKLVVSGLAVATVAAFDAMLQTALETPPMNYVSREPVKEAAKHYIDNGWTWLSTRLNGIGTTSRPRRLRMKCIGAINTPIKHQV